jgi:ATP-binding cassette subfamily B protein
MTVFRPGRAEDDLTAESVLHALTSVASRVGVDTTVDSLRRSYVLGSAKVETKVVIVMARDLGLDARAVTMKWSELPRLEKTLPAILRLADGTALVLEAVRQDPHVGRVVVLHDPTADALIAFDETQLTKVWVGEIILVKCRFRLTEENRPFGLGWLMGQVLRERGLFPGDRRAAIVMTVFTLAPPFLMMIVSIGARASEVRGIGS